MTLQAPTEQDMVEWILALRLHQIDLFRSRSAVFEQWLIKQGVKIPGGNPALYAGQFIEDGINQPLLDKHLEEE